MTNPEAAAWLEEQIDLGEGVAASGGWLPSTGPGFSAPEGLYAQMTEFGALLEGSWNRGSGPDSYELPRPNPEPVVIERQAYDLPTEYVDDVHPDPETWVRSLRAGGS